MKKIENFMDLKKEEFVENNYRVKKIRDKYIISNDQGNWVALTEKDYLNFKENKIEDNLLKLLIKHNILIPLEGLKKVVSSQRKRLSFLYSGASLHILTPTLRCNQKCVYCHSAAEKECQKDFDMDKKTADKVLNFIFQTPAKNITIEFQGGEPLLNFEIVKYVVKRAKEINVDYKKQIKFALISNLTCITEEIIDWIKKEEISMTTSLDGPKKVHDKNRILENGKPTYDIVVKNIKKLQERGIKIGALMVTTKQSLPYFKEIIDEYVKFGFTSLQIKYMNPLGFAKNTKERIGYSVEEFIDFWKKSADYIIELNKKGIDISVRYIRLILLKILTEYDPGFLDFRSPCGAVSGQIAYNHRGQIFCCDEGRENDMFNIGNVEGEEYKNLIMKPKCQQIISASINENYLCDNCVYKPWCGLCPVVAYAEQGNIIPKIASFSKCNIHKAQFDYVFEKILFDEEVKNIFIGWIKEKNINKRVE
jgi:His-Xaa-Ser system radical SAM maturase HxsB